MFIKSFHSKKTTVINSSESGPLYPGAVPIPQHRLTSNDPTERVHDLLVMQMCTTDDYIRQVLTASVRLREDLERTSKSAHLFAQSLGDLSEKFSSLVISSSFGDDAQNNSDEDQKRNMLVASVHQLAKYYALVAQHNQQISVSLMSEFESYIEDRQSKHREKCKQWANEYNASIVSLLDYIESMHVMAQDPHVMHKEEIQTEIRQKEIEVDETKRRKINQLIKSERHHYVHFTHRLQSSFRTQLGCFKDLYQQNISLIPDFIDTSNIQSILAKGDRPSQLFLRLRRPSDFRGSEKEGKSAGSVDEVSTLGRHAARKLSTKHTNDSGVELKSNSSTSTKTSPELKPKDSWLIKRSQSETVPKSGAEPKRTMMAPSVRYTRRATAIDPRSSIASIAKIKNLLNDRNIQVQKAIILYDYEGQGEADMSVFRDDEIDVISVEGEWAYALKEKVSEHGKKTLSMGWVPLAFTSICAELS